MAGRGRRSRRYGRERRRTPATYGADFGRNLRWRYRTVYGRGTGSDPYRSGGSVGRGYERAADLGFRAAEPGPPEPRGYVEPYTARHPGGVRSVRRPGRRPGTAARERDYGYPYFDSAAVTEAAQGYPPADTLHPETYPSPLGWGIGDYGEEYEPPAVVAARRAGRRIGRSAGGPPPRGGRGPSGRGWSERPVHRERGRPRSRRPR